MEAETDFSSTLRASSSAKAQRTLTVLIPVPAPLARRKQTQGENSVTAAHTRRMVSEQPDKLGAQQVDAGADKRRSLRHVRKEPEQGSIDGENSNCARPEIFSQVIEPTNHVLWNPLRPTEPAIGTPCSKVKKGLLRIFHCLLFKRATAVCDPLLSKLDPPSRDHNA